MSEEYRPFSLSTVQCHEIVGYRLKNATKKRESLKAFGQSTSRVDKEMVFLCWLKEALDSANSNVGVLFTYRELEEFIGDAREP